MLTCRNVYLFACFSHRLRVGTSSLPWNNDRLIKWIVVCWEVKVHKDTQNCTNICSHVRWNTTLNSDYSLYKEVFIYANYIDHIVLIFQKVLTSEWVNEWTNERRQNLHSLVVNVWSSCCTNVLFCFPLFWVLNLEVHKTMITLPWLRVFQDISLP